MRKWHMILEKITKKISKNYKWLTHKMTDVISMKNDNFQVTVGDIYNAI